MKIKSHKILLLLLSVLFTYCSSDDEVISYIENNNVEKLKELLSSGLNPNAPLNEGKTPIYHAINSGSLDILKLLVESGGDLNNRIDKVDYNLLTLENNNKDVAIWVIANSNKTYSRGERIRLINKIIENEWYEIIVQEDYCSKLEFEQLLAYYKKAKNNNATEFLSYLKPILKNYWSISEFTTQKSSIEEFYNKIESNKSNFNIEDTKQKTGSDELIIKFSNAKSFLNTVLEKLLSRPDKNDDGYKSGLKNSYFHNVTVQLPYFLPEYSRHQGYHTHDPPTTNESIWAYLVHRTTRSPENIELLWTLWEDTFYETITPEIYVNLDFYRSVETLISTIDSIKLVTDYKDSLDVFWNNIIDIHANTEPNDYESYGADWWGGISEGFIFMNNHGVNEYWLTSFWMRRHHEGNSEIVEDILRKIQNHYNKKPSLEKLIAKRNLKDATERFLVCANYNFLSEMKELLKEGVDPNLALGIGGIKKIHIAVMADDLKKLKKISFSKNALQQTDSRNYTPLHYATSTDIADYLVKKGEIDIKSEKYHGLISQYIYDKNPKLIKWALQNGASIEVKEKSTPLLIRATPCCKQPISKEEIKVIKLLLDAGADPFEKRPGDKTTPYEYAKKEGATEILEIFDNKK